MPRLILFSIVLVAVLFAFASCDKSRSRIVGKWQVVGGSADLVWEFSGNGRVSTPSGDGRYSFGDGKRIKIETPTAKFVHQLEFVDDRMIWKDPSGAKMELARVK